MAKITTKTAMDLVHALVSLNSYTATTKEGDTRRNVQETYDFKPELRLVIAKNITRLNGLVDAYTKTREGLLLQVTGGKSHIPAPEDTAPTAEKNAYQDKVAAFNRLNQMLMAEIHDVALLSVKEADLELKKNPIPPQALAALSPLLEGDGWDAPQEYAFATTMAAAARTIEAAAPLPNGRLDNDNVVPITSPPA